MIENISSRPVNYNKKLFRYRTAGAREYWIVDSVKQLIIVYNIEQDTYEEYSFSDKLKAGAFFKHTLEFMKTLNWTINQCNFKQELILYGRTKAGTA